MLVVQSGTLAVGKVLAEVALAAGDHADVVGRWSIAYV